jgi:hypothetical protein
MELIMRKVMADHSAMKVYPEKNNLQYFTFSRNSEKHMKTVIRHLPPRHTDGTYFQQPWGLWLQRHQREAIYDQSNSTKWTNLRRKTPSIPSYINKKRKISWDIQAEMPWPYCYQGKFINIAQTGLTQCWNANTWANCKHSPQCLWSGSGRLHMEGPEKSNTESTPSCCICTLVERKKPHPASYRRWSDAKGELQRRRAQRAPKGFSERPFFSKFTSPQQSYAAALRQDKQHQQPQATQTQQQYLPQREFQKRGLSVQVPTLSSNTTVATVVHRTWQSSVKLCQKKTE